MFERIAASGWLIVGAIILFVIFTTALFIMERKEDRKHKRKAQPLHIVRIEETKRAA